MNPKWLNVGVLLASPALVLFLAFFAAPLVVLVPVSFHPFDGSGIGASWTIVNYIRVVSDPFYITVFARTIGLGFLVAALCLVLCWPLASFIARSRSRFKVGLILVVIFPLLIDVVVRSFGWIVLLSGNGIINNILISLGIVSAPVKLIFNFTGLLIGMVHLMFPFMTLILAAAIRSIPHSVEDAASTLGSSPVATFFLVTVPLAMPGIVAGFVLVFVLTISSMVTPRLLGGPTYQVMATSIYDQFLVLLNWPLGAALAVVLTLLVMCLVFASGRFARRWVVQ